MEKKWDKEYSTQWDEEVIYLDGKGIKPTFIRTSIDTIRTYKYTKTVELFSALKEFYTN